PASYETYVGEIYVPVYYVCHHIAGSFVPDAVGGQDQGFEFASTSLCEQEAGLKSDFFAAERTLQHARHLGFDDAQQDCKPCPPALIGFVRQVHGIDSTWKHRCIHRILVQYSQELAVFGFNLK